MNQVFSKNIGRIKLGYAIIEKNNFFKFKKTFKLET